METTGGFRLRRISALALGRHLNGGLLGSLWGSRRGFFVCRDEEQGQDAEKLDREDPAGGTSVPGKAEEGVLETHGGLQCREARALRD